MADLILLSRVEIPAGEKRRLTNRVDLSATVWLEKGACRLLDGDGDELALSPGIAVPVAPGKHDLHNSSAKVAVVFVAMASGVSAQAGTFTATCTTDNEDLVSGVSRAAAIAARKKHLEKKKTHKVDITEDA